MGYVLGVDFGTSFTAAVAYSAGSSRVVTLGKRAGAVPTATYVREDGTLIHGEDAFLVGAHDPERLVRNLKRRQRFGGMAHGFPVGLAAHDDGDGRGHIFESSRESRNIGRIIGSAPREASSEASARQAGRQAGRPGKDAERSPCTIPSW